MNIKLPSRKSLMGAGLVLLLLAFAGAWHNGKALAQTAGESPGDFADVEFQSACVKHALRRFFQNVGASEEQKAQITTLVEGKFARNQSQREKLKTGFKEIIGLAQDETVSNEALKARIESLKDLRNQMMNERLDTFLQIRGMLDKEQKAKLGRGRFFHNSRTMQE